VRLISLLEPRLAIPIAIVASAFALRLIGLNRYGLDGDEVFSVMTASASWPDLFIIAAKDISHPPLYYAMLKLWLMIDSVDEGWIRGLSVVTGIGTLIFTKRICDVLRMSVVDTAFVLFLIAANGLLIYYAQHARMFSLLQLTSVAQLYIFLLFVRSPTTRSRFVGLVIANLLLVYSHYWGWVFLASEFIALLWLNRAKLVAFTAAGLCTVVGFLPWTLVVLWAIAGRGAAMGQIRWMGAGVPGISDYVWLIGRLNGGLSFAHSTTLSLLIFGAPIAVFVWMSLTRRERLADRAGSPIPWIIFVVAPLLLTSAASYILKQNVWGERHLQIVAIPYYILLGLSFDRIGPSALAMFARAIIVVWAVWASVEWFADTHQKLEWRSIAQRIGMSPDANAPVIASEHFVSFPLGYQLRRLIPGIRVDETSDVSSISADRFWFVYRDWTWRQPLPPDKLFEERGYSVDKEISTTSGPQTIIALFVHKHD